MKPITLSPAILARESGYLAACLLTALGANIYAVIHFHRPAVELFSQLGFVVVITIALYIYILILRLIFHGVKLAWSKMRKPHK